MSGDPVELGPASAPSHSGQELVGHSTLTMTLRYMHPAPSALTEANGLLDNFGQPVGNTESAAV